LKNKNFKSPDMNNKIKILLALLTIGLLFPIQNTQAGNEDRVGQAGAQELLINPWARSSGWGDAGTACVRGLEAQYINIAGTAFTQRTELVFSRTNWLDGADISINSFGFTQSLGENKGVIGFGIMSMNFGDILITKVDLPEGGVGTFSPSLLNISLSYAKAFSNSIYGGVNFKIINESISDMSASGIAIDAGIQYVTGKLENVKFGISLKNVGPTMKFSGDGLSIRGILENDDNTLTIEQRSEYFELPSLVRIGFAYDLYIGESHTMTGAANFTSNSFSNDQYSFGLQYNWNDILYLRGGYVIENNLFDDYDAGRTTALTGPTAGLSVQAPLNKEKGSVISIDYSYRASDPFSGSHSIGARISL
jgi:hypothetical protein